MLVRIMTSWDGGDVPPDPEGFVHLSRPEQAAGTVQRHYAGAAALVFLVVDEALLPAGALRVEDSGGHGLYPHLYAPLPARAVLAAIPWRRGEPLSGDGVDLLAGTARASGPDEDLTLEDLADEEVAAVERVVRALADEDVAALHRAGAYDGGADPYLWTRDHGQWPQVHLVVPPDPASSWVSTVIRTGSGDLAVGVELWTREEGPSDLTLELHLWRDAEGAVQARLRDLRVR